MPIAVAARSKAWVGGRSPAQIAGSNPAGGHGRLFESCELIARPEECYRLWCVVM